MSLAMALWVWVCVPLDPPVTMAQGYAGARPWADGARLPPAPSTLHKASTAPSQTGLARLRQTLSARGPWLVALIFAMYSSQWLAVIGFLPTTVARAGLAAGVGAVLTASVAAVNILGNVLAGRLLQRGVPAQRLLLAGFGAMGLGALLAFGTWQGQPLPLAAQFAALLGFSALGGIVPGTLFTLAMRVAPSADTVSTTVGWMQQFSALGQFVGPPVVAWAALRAGGWEWTGAVTGLAALVGMLLTLKL